MKETKIGLLLELTSIVFKNSIDMLKSSIEIITRTDKNQGINI